MKLPIYFFPILLLAALIFSQSCVRLRRFPKHFTITQLTSNDCQIRRAFREHPHKP